ncbi:MAG TPA: thioredoxin family protein [Myxococcota bacterium]|nr:thioredoxin family protein [Myxococcota bacterium]
MLLAWMVACGTPQPAAPSPQTFQSTPVGEARENLVVQPSSDRRPDGREPLTIGEMEHLAVEGLDALTADQRVLAMAFFNGTTGPCPTCMDEGTPLGACFEQAPPGCDNVPVVARRVVRLAGEGLDVDAISLQVEYADAWYDLDATDLPRTGPEGAAVELVVAFDATSQLSNEAEARWTGIAEACPGHVAIFRLDVREHAEVAESYGVRSTPTAFVNGYRVRGSQQAEAYLRLVRAELGDRGLSCQG